uniref:Uncharacterized protein n=1 Tax=Cacopsylla melanoneura TaxID=428564 RepID=A0A8D8YWG9_9HEMI
MRSYLETVDIFIVVTFDCVPLTSINACLSVDENSFVQRSQHHEHENDNDDGCQEMDFLVLPELILSGNWTNFKHLENPMRLIGGVSFQEFLDINRFTFLGKTDSEGHNSGAGCENRMQLDKHLGHVKLSYKWRHYYVSLPVL